MKINNKNFQDWTEEDLKVLLHNDAYRENNFIDYKVDFAPFKCEDKNKKKEKQAEFMDELRNGRCVGLVKKIKKTVHKSM
jgi:hypothetical protein